MQIFNKTVDLFPIAQKLSRNVQDKFNLTFFRSAVTVS